MQANRDPAASTPASAGPRLPRAADLRAAVGLLTPLPLAAPEVFSAQFGRAAPLFPLIGVSIGSALFALDWALTGVAPATLRLPVVVALWHLATRGSLRRRGALPVVLTVLVLITKLSALVAITPPAALALLFAPLLGSWSIVVLAVGARDAASTGRKLAPGVLFNEFAVTSLFTFAVVFGIADGLGILLVVIAAAVTVGLRVLLHQQHGGMSTASLMLGAEAIEVLTLLLLAGLQT